MPVATIQTFAVSTEQNGQMLPASLFEFWYLPTTLASEATSVAFTPVARRVTVLLPNRALGYPHAFTVSHCDYLLIRGGVAFLVLRKLVPCYLQYGNES